MDPKELTTGTSIHGTPDISTDGKTVTFARNDGERGIIYRLSAVACCSLMMYPAVGGKS